MKKLLFIIISISVFSCSNPKKEETDKIELFRESIALKEKEISQNLQKFDINKGNELISLYTEYAQTYPRDSMSAQYLFNAADLSVGVKRFDNAISLFDKVYKEFPNYEKNATSLFMVAFVYDEHLKLKGKAADVYNEFIKKFPNHDFVDDAKFSIQNLNKSEEDLIQMFKEKNSGI